MKRAFVSAVCLCIILFWLSSEVAAQWVQTAGPTGGYVQSLDRVGSDVYAFVPWGGLYRSADNGASWVPVNLAPNLARSVVAFTVLDSKFFVRTLDYELFMSVDFGDTWTLVDPPGDFCTMRPKLARGSEIFATGCARGVYLSNDDLITWKPVNKGLTYTDLTSWTVSYGVVFAGNRYGDIHRYNDTDSSWTQVYSNPTELNISGVVVNDGKIYAALDGDGVIVSSDQGDSWTALNSGLPNLNLHHLKAIDSRVYVPSYPGLYRLNDEGTGWTPMGPDGEQVLAVEISGPNLIVSTQRSGVLISSDDGANWAASNSGIVSAEVNDLVIKGERIIAATNQGLQITRDGGDHWESTGPAGIFGRCMEACGSYVIAATPEVLYRSNDDGESWTVLTSAPGFTDLESSGNMLVGGNSSGVLLSTDFGGTWTATSITQNIFGVGYFGSTILASKSDSIFVSHDDGVTWTKSCLNPSKWAGLTWSFAQCGADFFAASDGDGVYISSDSGLTWSPANGGSGSPVDLTGEWIMPLFARGTTVYAGGYVGLCSTDDRGETWLPVGDRSDCVIAIGCNESEILVGVSNMGVWKRSLESCCRGVVGDANFDGALEPTIGDVAALIDMLFISQQQLACMAEADVNRSGGSTPSSGDISIGDVSMLIDHLFVSGTPLLACP